MVTMVDSKRLATDARKRGGIGHKKLIVGLVMIIIVIGVLYYLYETYGSLPVGVISMMASGHALNATSLKTLILQKIISTPNFRANYSGNITINKDPTMIVNIANINYGTGNNGALYYKLGVFELQNLGDLTLSYSTDYNYSNPNLCVLTDNQQIIQEIGAAGPNIAKCENPQNHPRFSGIVANLLVNVSSFDNLNISSYGVSSYDGKPCYSASGSGIIDVNSIIVGANSGPYIPAKLNFSTCLSAQYNLPLYLNAQIVPTSGATILINLSNFNMGPSDITTGQANLP